MHRALTLDPVLQVLHIDGEPLELTPRETELLEYLFAHRGEVVSHEALERDVWKFAPGVRSKAVPVAVRTLRRKMGDAGKMLHTLRGRGFRLAAGPAPAAGGPSWGSPWVEREREERALRALLESDWAHVTVVGPAGCGKTRLVSHVLGDPPLPVIWVDLSGCSSPDQLESVVARALGTDGEPSAARAALRQRSARGTWTVFDHADAVIPSLRDLLAAAPAARCLTTSTRAADVPTETVLELAGFTREEGRRFVRSRLRTAAGDPSDPHTWIDRLVDAFDGLPLALEVSAAHPLGIEEVVRHAESGTAIGGGRLDDTLRSAIEGLSGPDRRLLHELAAVPASLSTEDLLDWRGPEAIEGMARLARQSLVMRSGRRWALLQTLRRFLNHQPDAAADSTADGWLVRRIAALDELSTTEPARAFDAWEPLLPAVLAAIPRLGVEEAFTVVDAMIRYASSRGPARLAPDSAGAAFAAHPEVTGFDTLARWLQAAEIPLPEVEALERAEDYRWRLWGVMIRSRRRPLDDPEGYATRLLAEAPTPLLRARATFALYTFLLGSAGWERLGLPPYREALAQRPGLRWWLDEFWVRERLEAGDDAEELLHYARRLETEVADTRCFLQTTYARILVTEALTQAGRVEEAEARLEALGADADLRGNRRVRSQANGRRMVCRLALGDFEGTLKIARTLEAFAPVHRRMANLCARMARLCAGETDLPPRIAEPPQFDEMPAWSELEALVDAAETRTAESLRAALALDPPRGPLRTPFLLLRRALSEHISPR